MLRSFSWALLVERVASYIGGGIRRCAGTFAVILCAGILLLAAGGFGLASGYLALAQEMPPYLAALCVAAALAVAGAIPLVILWARRRRSLVGANDRAGPELARQAEELAGRVMKESLTAIRQEPSSALLTAVVLGVIVGLLRRDPPG